MKKKNELTEQQYLSYQQNHEDPDVIDVEEEKIGREKAGYAEQRRKSNTRLKQQLQSLSAGDEEFELPEEEIVATRILRNAHTHKRRLAGLRKFQEED